MPNKTIIIGDCHIGKGTSIGKSYSASYLNSRVQDQKVILDWILQQGIEHDVDEFILTGDVFEEVKPDHELVVMFLSWLEDCSTNNIVVYIIAGNHDLKRVGAKYSSVLDIIKSSNIEGVHVINHIDTIHKDGVSFTLIPFRDKRSLAVDTCEEGIDKLMGNISYEVASMPFGNDKVCVGHLAMEGSFYTDEIDNMSNELMIPASKFEDFEYVWMGHVHTPQVMHKKNPYIAHTGSMDLSDFGECDHIKKITLYDTELESKFIDIDIPSRKLNRIIEEVPEDKEPTDYILNKIRDIGKDKLNKSIVKIEVKILNPDAESIGRNKVKELLLNEFGVFHISSFSESKASFVIPKAKMHIKDSAIKPKEAVNLVTDTIEFEDDLEKEQFKELCLNIIEEHKALRK